jgi:hypothetical protein
MFHVNWPFPPPPHLTCLMCGESYIYRVLRNDSSVHSVAVARSCDTLVLTASSSSSSVTSSPFFILPRERVNWLFFKLSLCLPSDCSKNDLIRVDSIQPVPLGLLQNPLGSLLRTIKIYCILCIYHISLHSYSIQFFTIHLVKYSIQMLCFNQL